MFQDIRYAARALRNAPGFTAVAAISVALAIAANSTVFSIINATLFGLLPVKEPARLVSLSEGSMSYPDYVDYRDQTGVFEGLSAHFPLVPVSLGGGEPERVWGQMVTANYFNVLGLQPVLGRGFLPDEDRVAGRNPVVVLADGLWRRRFGSDPNIVAKTVTMNNRGFTVVGVMPPGFHGEDRWMRSEFWMPLSMTAQVIPDLMRDGDPFHERDHSWLMLTGRLKPGIGREQATAAVNVVKSRIDAEYHKGDKHRRRMKLTNAGSIPDGGGNYVVGLFAVLMVVVGLVLLIACANVANLLLARAASRQREMGIRLAIGAGRGRLIRQLLAESLLLSLLGSAGGLALAYLATGAISSLRLPVPFPVSFDFRPDTHVLAFTAALSILTAILFGLAPALRATRTDLVNALKNAGATFGGSRRFGMRNVLVVVQVAVSLILLVGAGLFLRSLRNASSIDTGMRADGVLTMAFDPKLHSYTVEQSRRFVSQLRQRIEALPGVQSMSYVDIVPLSIGSSSTSYKAEGKETHTDIFRVGMRYFDTMGVALTAGRDFDSRRDTGETAIVNATMARRLFGDQNPLGRRVTSDDKKFFEVIGVSANAKSRTLGEEPTACIYQFLEADPNENISFFGTTVLVKASGRPEALIRPVREQVLALDRNLAVFNIETMRDHLEKALLIPRISATLLVIFGAVGLTLAIVGLYGVMSFSVRRRTREIGIRMALGAPAGGVLRMVTRQGMVLAAIGIVAGLALAVPGGRLAATVLYGVSATDPVTFGLVPAVLSARGAGCQRHSGAARRAGQSLRGVARRIGRAVACRYVRSPGRRLPPHVRRLGGEHCAPGRCLGPAARAGVRRRCPRPRRRLRHRHAGARAGLQGTPGHGQRLERTRRGTRAPGGGAARSRNRFLRRRPARPRRRAGDRLRRCAHRR